MLFGKLGQYIDRVTVAAVGEPSKLGYIAPLGCQLNELVGRIADAQASQAAKLIHIAPLAGKLHQLIDRVLVTFRGPLSQVRQIRIRHARIFAPA